MVNIGNDYTADKIRDVAPEGTAIAKAGQVELVDRTRAPRQLGDGVEPRADPSVLGRLGPLIGQDNTYVLQGLLGLDTAQLEALAAADAIT